MKKALFSIHMSLSMALLLYIHHFFKCHLITRPTLQLPKKSTGDQGAKKNKWLGSEPLPEEEFYHLMLV